MGLSIEDILQVHDSEGIDIGEWLSGLSENERPQVEIIHYTSDGWDIEAILVLPPGWKREVAIPTLVYLHGGPERRNQPILSNLISARGESAAMFLASHGYVVFLPNFRGSSGYGQEFMNELQDYQLMKKPFRDVMTGVNTLIDRGIADGDRLAIYGSSYGAQLGAWVISHTDRFRGSVLCAGRYDTLTHDRCSGRAFHSLKPNRQGNSGPLDMWLKPEVYNDLSPMQHVNLIKTPVLLIETGAERKDMQARMLFNALQALGVESYWVYYPDAFHTGRWNDFCKRDYMSRLLAWFDYCLKGVELPTSFNQKIVTIESEGIEEKLTEKNR